MTAAIAAARARRLLVPAVVVAAALGVAPVRLLVEARRAVAAAEAACARGDLDEGVRSYLDAVRMHLPASPYTVRALDGLAAIAAAAAARGDDATVRRAWQATRVGLAGTRSLFTPRRLERRLAEAEGRLGIAPGPGAAGPGAASASAVVGFGLFVGAALAFVLWAVGRDVRLVPARALFFAAVFAGGVALFLVGLRFA